MTTPQVQKLPLSITLIAHNEAHNIRRCLASVASWASEIIVVINDCTDGTDKIAESYGARVYEHPWRGHRDQKQLALQYVTQPWVFAIDADEEVSDALRESLFTFFKQDATNYAGAYFPRKVWFLGRWITHGDWYPDYSLRLFRHDKGRWAGSQEHDKIALEGRAKKLKGDLHHYSYISLNAQLEKIPYFSDIFLKRLLEKGARWSSFAVVFRAFWRFIRCYFLRLGFLDGFPGFYVACFQGYSTLFRYTRLYEHLQQKHKT